jgi:Fur family peroxide stress response transcriptional regulator
MRTHQPFARERLRSFERFCRARRLPVTVQRRAVFEALAARGDHPTADQIYEDVRTKLPEVSRTTVYRVLETFGRLGVAQSVCHPGSSARYDANMERHHHLVCVRCGKMRDLADAALDRIPLPSRRCGFRVLDGSVYLRGVCSECRDAERSARRSTRSRAEEKR